MTTVIRNCQSFHFHKYQVNIFIKPTIIINQNRSHQIRESAGAQVRWSTHNPEEGGLCAGGRQCLTVSAVLLYFRPLTTCSKGHGPSFSPFSRFAHASSAPFCDYGSLFPRQFQLQNLWPVVAFWGQYIRRDFDLP